MISLTITGDGGCTSSDSLEIVVNDLPVVNLTIDNSEICLGESVSLNTNSGYNNYDWTPSSISSNSDTYMPTSLTDNQISVTITGWVVHLQKLLILRFMICLVLTYQLMI